MKPTALTILAALLAGCGGRHDDGNCVLPAGYTPSAKNAGTYDATFAPSGGAGGTVAFRLVVAADGTVTGTAHDPDVVPEEDVPVSGTVGGLPTGCGSPFYANASLAFALPGQASGYLQAASKGSTRFEGTLPATRGNGVAGSLTVAKVAAG